FGITLRLGRTCAQLCSSTADDAGFNRVRAHRVTRDCANADLAPCVRAAVLACPPRMGPARAAQIEADRRSPERTPLGQSVSAAELRREQTRARRAGRVLTAALVLALVTVAERSHAQPGGAVRQPAEPTESAPPPPPPVITPPEVKSDQGAKYPEQ